ncbi:MAG: hypothetical protein KDI63_08180 [Gammaproteobacteria bacterium]|nr:hypothetical protein [Gammaproteobacteria bacterium]
MQYEDDIRLNEFGNPDIEYYMAKARQLRALAVAELIQQVAGWISHGLRKIHVAPLSSAIRH